MLKLVCILAASAIVSGWPVASSEKAFEKEADACAVASAEVASPAVAINSVLEFLLFSQSVLIDGQAPGALLFLR